ncbi:hypothetical protein OIV83_003308 [Microbotryomycetes sp. JL201]|nr:hypothetical protein OIV83_003308 [Microbotryomycetes sp. JL201]
MSRPLRIAVCQFAPGSLDADANSDGQQPQRNLDRALEYVRQAAEQHANVVCFPEYFLTGIMADPKHHTLAQPPHKSQRHEHVSNATPSSIESAATWLESFRHVAQEVVIDIVVGTIVESGHEPTPSMHNVSHYIQGKTGKVLESYHKRNLWHPEKEYLQPGRESHVVFETAYGRVGLLVCWDLAWPEAFRSLLLQNVDVVYAPTCWLGSDGADIGLEHDPRCEEKFLDSLIVARAFENECVVVLANCGGEAKDGWIGRSRVAVPFKGSVAEAKSEQEELFFADVDLGILKDAREVYGIRTDLVPKLKALGQLPDYVDE